MKEFLYKLEEHEINSFPNVIRNRFGVIKILTLLIDIILYRKPEINTHYQFPYFIIRVDKMSRIFVFEEKRYYSCNFPFAIHVDDDTMKIVFDNEFEIDTQILSYITSSTNNNNLSSIDKISEELYERVFDENNDEDIINLYYNRCIRVISKLLSFEIGYLRCDYDDITPDEEVHPLNHIDVNFTTSATYKLGLSDKITPEKLIDLIDGYTKCAQILF